MYFRIKLKIETRYKASGKSITLIVDELRIKQTTMKV